MCNYFSRTSNNVMCDLFLFASVKLANVNFSLSISNATMCHFYLFVSVIMSCVTVSIVSV